jgi:DNA-binding MarR family transcriptional regulator
MARDPEIDAVAGAVQAAVRLLVQRLRSTQTIEGEPTSSETSVLARLDRTGPTTATELARLERISPQSMGATVAALEERGLVGRSPDPDDGRRLILSLSVQGRALLQRRRSARSELLSAALESSFSRAEVRQLQAAAPLIERLAEHL